jgi:hypothetical protein
LYERKQRYKQKAVSQLGIMTDNVKECTVYVCVLSNDKLTLSEDYRHLTLSVAKFITLEQAMKDLKRSRCIALLFL